MPKKQNVPSSVKAALHRQAVKGEIKHPDLAKLVAHFFACAGGERQVAKMLFTEFQEAHEGSLVRQRILDMIMRALKYTNDKQAPTDDLGILSEDDISRELDELIREVSDDVDPQHPGPKPQEAKTGPDPEASASDPAGDTAPGAADSAHGRSDV